MQLRRMHADVRGCVTEGEGGQATRDTPHTGRQFRTWVWFQRERQSQDAPSSLCRAVGRRRLQKGHQKQYIVNCSGLCLKIGAGSHFHSRSCTKVIRILA